MTTPPIVAFAGQQAQAARDVNTASLCRIGQETVQDIVLRTMEIFQLLRNMQLPNGVTYHPSTHQDRLGKLQEHLRMLSVLFRKLRLVYDKCNENCTGLDPVPPERLCKLLTVLINQYFTATCCLEGVDFGPPNAAIYHPLKLKWLTSLPAADLTIMLLAGR
uniref:Mediator of RNA polymerase II transcription subunit 30 n=1 Tax=Oncorhynchus tshawytscha TaxID=74940 RepID=A0A8C8DBA8_ONCTS